MGSTTAYEIINLIVLSRRLMMRYILRFFVLVYQNYNVKRGILYKRVIC